MGHSFMLKVILYQVKHKHVTNKSSLKKRTARVATKRYKEQRDAACISLEFYVTPLNEYLIGVAAHSVTLEPLTHSTAPRIWTKPMYWHYVISPIGFHSV